MNIIMNAPQIQLGQQLQDFREATKEFSTALRGHHLGSNAFIRSIHNSFTRRMDHLNADLALEHEATKPRPKKSKSAPKKAGTKKKKQAEEFGFHFIAYVPRDEHVWELDGLKTKPHRLGQYWHQLSFDFLTDLTLGPIEDNDWTTVARPQIEARMLQYEEDQHQFSLLGFCQSPLAVHSRKVAENLASLRGLQERVNAQVGDGTWEPANPLKHELGEFELDKEAVKQAEIPAPTRQRIDEATRDDADTLYDDIALETRATMGEYRAELMSTAEDEQRVKGRKKDYGPFLHAWVKKLAEKGVLEDIICGK